MDEDQGRGGPPVNGAAEERTPEAVRSEIEQTRAELGDTVEALVEKTNVKAQAKHAVAGARSTVADRTADVKQAVTGRTADVKQAVTGRTADVKQAMTGRTADVKQAMTGKKADVKQVESGREGEVAVAAQESTPDSVADAGGRARAMAQANRPALVAAATFGLGLLIGSRRGR